MHRTTLLLSWWIASCCGGGAPSAGFIEDHAARLAQGDGKQACQFLAAHRDVLTERCNDHVEWFRKNAPWYAGSSVNVISSGLHSGDTQATVVFNAKSDRGSGTLKFTFACDPGRDSYPSHCEGGGRWWIMYVELAK